MYTKGKLIICSRAGHSDGVRPVLTTEALDGIDRIAIISYRGVPSIKEANANAKRLVKCWNEFDGLVAALERLAYYAGTVKDCGASYVGNGKYQSAELRKAVTIASEALKQARGVE